MSSKVPPPPTAAAPPEPKLQNNNNSSGILHYHSPQMRGLLGQDFGLLPETSQVTDVTGMSASSQHHHHHHHHQQQQQHQHQAAAAAATYMSNAYGGGAESVGRESEGQPLRHFFDDWPRSSRDQSHAMTWGSAAAGVDESTERSNSDNHHHHHHHLIHNPNNNTQLSISIPITTPSSAMTLSAQRPGSPPAGTILFNNLSNFA